MTRLLSFRQRLVGRIDRRLRAVLALVAFMGAVIVLTLVGSRFLSQFDLPLLSTAAVLAAVVLLFVPRLGLASDRNAMARTVPSSRALLMLDYASIARRRGRRSIVATLERTRSVPGREILATLASNGRYSIDDLVSTLEDYRDPVLRPAASELLSQLHRPWLVELARLLVIQGTTVQQVLTGATMYDLVADLGGIGEMERSHARCYAEALIACGRPDEARALVSAFETHTEHDLRLLAETVNPFARAGERSDQLDEWLTHVNSLFALDSLEPVDIQSGAPTAFDALRCGPVDAIQSPHSVTVVITSFRPDQSLFTAVQSVLASSWSNIEVLVIDDASGEEYGSIYAEIAALDPRVRVESLSVNGGTYVGRNHALSIISSEFVTFHDSDDWMHPRRIERQIEQLLANPALLANASRSVRVTAELQFSHHRSMEAKVCEPSIMLRRAAVLDLIGFFDRVRKNGDTEYRRRLEAATGTLTPIVGEVPLTWQRTISGSLSYADVGRSWISPARRAYMNCAAAWHKSIAEQGASPYVTASAQRSMPFYAPPEMLGTDTAGRHFDVIFLSNWLEIGSHGGSQRSNEEEVMALVDAGFTVAISHIEALWFMHGWLIGLSDRVIALLATGKVELVQLDSTVTADLLIVRYPPVLQFASAVRSSISASKVVIVANQAPLDADGTGRRYDVDTVTRRASTMFGVEPIWAPQGPIMRELLERSVAHSRLHTDDMPAILDRSSWSVTRASPSGRKPVVGRYSRDHASKWPADRDVILDAYNSDRFSTHIMGGPQTLVTVFGTSPIPSGWLVLSEGEQPTREFLAGIDFFVYFHAESYREAFGRSIVEAMASGAVVIMQRSFEPVFADAAVYCEPRDVEELVVRLHADNVAYAAQVARGYDYIRRNSSHEAYLKRIRTLISTDEQLPTLA